MGDAAPARLIGRYLVVGALGEGAMGEVVRARDERLGREVAIKKVKNVFGMLASTFHARFEAEARALAALAHPGVVQVFDLGVDGDEPYLVMELVDGPTLRAVITDHGPLAPADVRVLGIQLARALEAAHARGILHRDVKPANVLRAPGGVWKLADFGVAHVPDSDVTVTGQFLGTPAYAAPEALTAGEFSPGSDVYALAATLVEAATGKKPRPDATLAQLIAQSSEPVVLTALSPELAAVLGPALALDPARRPSAAVFAERLAAAAVVGRNTPLPVPAVALPSALDATSPLGATAALPGTSPRATPATAVSVVTLPGQPTARRRLRALAIAGGVIVAIGLLALGATNDSSKNGAAVPLPTGGPARPSPRPGQPTAFTAPPGLAGKAARDWSKVAQKVHDGDPDEALDKLMEFERKHGASAESRRLRAWLEQASPRYDD